MDKSLESGVMEVYTQTSSGMAQKGGGETDNGEITVRFSPCACSEDGTLSYIVERRVYRG